MKNTAVIDGFQIVAAPQVVVGGLRPAVPERNPAGRRSTFISSGFPPDFSLRWGL